MRLREVFRYEVEYRLRSASTWAYGGLLLFLTSWIFLFSFDGSSAVIHADAPDRVARISVLIGMAGVLVSAGIFGDAAVRDVESGMDSLLFTSPVRKIEYLGGRFLGALAMNAVVLVAVPLGEVAATLILRRVAPDVFGPFRAATYLQPFLVFVLPNLVLMGAILFSIGMLVRQTIPVYLGAIGAFVGYLLAFNSGGRIDNPTVAVLADPLGISALLRLTQYWTAAEQNSRLVGLPAALAGNRLIWLAVAAVVLALLHRRFRFTDIEGGGRRRRERRAALVPELEGARPMEIPRVAGAFGVWTPVRQAVGVAQNSLAEVAASRWFLVTALGCVGLTLLFGWNVADTVFDTSTWPVTFLVTESVLSQRIVPVFYVLIALYAGELVWKERETGVSEIADAAPVPEGARLAGQFVALVVMLALLQVAVMIGGLLIQALQGYTHFEVGLYLRVLFGLNLTGYVLLAALAMTIHVVVDHKYLGHIIAVMAFVFPVMAPQLGIARHHLLLYASDPGWTYSDMNGFGPFVGPIVWFRLYWTAWALLLAVTATLLWVRGRETGVRSRLLVAAARFRGPAARVAAAAMALMVVLGGFIFYNTNVLNDYRTADAIGTPRADYERRYRRFEHLAQPTIENAELRVEIYPQAPAVDLRGTYELVNRTSGPVDAVHVYLTRPIEARSFSFDRSAELQVEDQETGYRIYALRQPLAPGESLRLSFDATFRPRGFTNRPLQTDVVSNGAYFDRTWLPFVGYQPVFELSDEKARARFGLDPRPPAPGPDDDEARQYRWPVRGEDRVRFETIIGTSADQIAVTAGALRRSWTEDGRAYFDYETEGSIPFSPTVFSAKYAVLDDRWRDPTGSGQDVNLRIYHHPDHPYNLDRVVRSLKASLDYYTAQFGRYPDSRLTVLEIPRYGSFGRAHWHMIAFTEDALFSRVRDGEIDQPFYGTAHEVAHQWWGGQVRSAAGVRGYGFLSESLANYSAMMLTEKAYGAEAVRRIYDVHMRQYLSGRATQSQEVPLLDVEDQPYIAYRKGAIAMHTLREQIGEERVNAALRRYVETFRDAGPPYPTSRDLYAELQAVTPEPLQSLLTDLFETITLWDVRTDQATVEPTGTGEYEVTLEVAARKMRSDGVGNETEVPMDDLVELGIFAAGGQTGPGEPLYLERRRIHSGEQTLRVLVGREPARAGLDPYHKLIERQANDNVVDVEDPATASGHPGP